MTRNELKVAIENCLGLTLNDDNHRILELQGNNNQTILRVFIKEYDNGWMVGGVETISKDVIEKLMNLGS